MSDRSPKYVSELKIVDTKVNKVSFVIFSTTKIAILDFEIF